MIFWTLFFLKYLALYLALVNFASNMFLAVSFWSNIDVGKRKIGWWFESVSFVVYLMLSNFV